VRELQGELEAEQRRHADAQKTVRRNERRIQELTQISEDEEKARDAERETIEKLQSKMKQYKRDLDDAVSHCIVCFSKILWVWPIDLQQYIHCVQKKVSPLKILQYHE